MFNTLAGDSKILSDPSEGTQSDSSARGSALTPLGARSTWISPRFVPADESLIADLVSGSKDALGVLFRRHRRPVLNVATRILKNVSEAEDVCQEVFLLVFQKAKTFDPNKGAASSWIIQIAYSRALNRRRYLALRHHYNAQELNEEQIESDTASLFIDEILAETLLMRLREQLSPEQRETMELHFFEGYSLREVAEKTRQTHGNVRHHYYRGLERLRTYLFSQKDR